MTRIAAACLMLLFGEARAQSSFEWAGVFSLTGMTSPSKWSMQASADGNYPDQSMKVVIIPTTTPDEATMASLESAAETLVAGTCTPVADSGEMTPAADGSCFTLNVGSGNDSEFDIVTTGLTGVVVFAQHVPIEFERDRHYFYDAAGTDIEPIAENAVFEWSGVFSLTGMTSPSKWSMQASADGNYPDPSMMVVIIPTTTPDEATMNTLESDAVGLLGLFGASCEDVAAGGSITPVDGGACYTLIASTTDADTEYDIVTTGLTGVAVYAQHIPIEFERDRHYFYDGAGTDIEPDAESEHDVAHSHGPVTTLCGANEHVSSNVCTLCPVGSTRPAGDDASGDDTACAVTAAPAPPPSSTCVATTAGVATIVGGITAALL